MFKFELKPESRPRYKDYSNYEEIFHHRTFPDHVISATLKISEIMEETYKRRLELYKKDHNFYYGMLRTKEYYEHFTDRHPIEV